MTHAAHSAHAQVLRLLAQNRLDDAAAAAHALVAAQPGFIAAWIAATTVELRRGRADVALRTLDSAPAAVVGDPGVLLHRAYTLHALKRSSEALVAADESLVAAAGDAALLDAVGTFYSLMGRHDLARAAYDQSIALAPSNSKFLYNRATVRRFLGDLSGAEMDYERALAFDPLDYEAHKNLSDLRPQNPQRNHVQRLERLLAAPIPDWRGEVQIRHALAKECEDLGDYRRSFAQLSRGAALRRRHMQYDVGGDVATVGWIIEAFSDPSAPLDTPANGPVFIVGLPRTGTTLVERVLSCHPQIYGAGELNDFAQALVDAVRATAGGATLSRQDVVTRSRDVDFAALGQEYLRRARPQGVTPARFTDKMPLNYLYCGLIRRALPTARIVHLRRHPMAACYAIYKTLFRDGYPFSYDLDELARYYAAYRRLMAHWQATLPGAIHEVQYEALVNNLEGEARTLLAFCGLAWDPVVLAFDQNPEPSTTASAAQVRRPLYRSSLNQWQCYDRELDGLRRRLRELGIADAELDR